MQERLQKIISASGLMSRRAAEECIKAGRVSVNGSAAPLGMSADSETDDIRVDGKALPKVGGKRYIMLNKPKGYVTTLHDEKGRPCVTELLHGLDTRVYPVGRLDMYSEGLLICTNDGDFANKLMHPSHEVEKCYLTWVQGEDIGEAVEYLRYPMEIDGYMTRGAEVDIISVAPGGAELAVFVGQREDLVATGLNGAALMHADVPRVGRDHALIGPQQCVDHRGVGLCSAYQKKDLCIWRVAGAANFFPGGAGIVVQSIARCFFKVGFPQTAEDRRVGALHVVAGK